MKPTFEDESIITQLTGIATDLKFSGSTVIFRGKEYAGSEQTQLATVTNLLYSECYALKLALQSGNSAAQKMPGTTDASFLKQLTEANESRERMEQGWVIRQLLTPEHAEVSRNNISRHVPVTFIRNSTSHPLTPGLPVSVYFPKEEKGQGNGFYYVFGNHATSAGQNLVRVYWNISAAGAVPLISWITKNLNRYHIPFIFKCLNHPEMYTRRDAAVLYLEENNCSIMNMLLPDCSLAMNEYLHDDVPLFAHAYHKGIGIAESPGPYESFGMQRMGLVARAAIQGLPQNPSAGEFTERVAALFTAHGINPQKPFLNNGSQTLPIWETRNLTQPQR